MPTTSGPVRATRREPIALFALGSLLVLAPELLGGVYPWGALAIAVLAASALLTAIWANQGRTQLRGALWVLFLVALAWTSLQALPVPCGLLRPFARESVEQLERVHALLDRGAPGLCTFSRDPGATRLEIVKGLALLCGYAAALLLVQLGQRRNVLRTLALGGVVLAAVSLAHAALGASTVFGVYVPIEVSEQPFLSPVLNLNSLGGALALCWPIALALALSTRDTNERAFWLIGSAVLATTVLMTRSRGAAGALALELVLFGLLGMRVRERIRTQLFSKPIERLSLALGVIVAIALSVYSSYGELLLEFQRGAWDKLDLIAAAGGFAAQHFWLGIGRGAFSSVFAGAQQGGARRFEHAENFVVQWAAEWGTPLCIALLVVIVIAVIGGARNAKSWERCGAIVGVLGLAAQNLVDLGMELVAIAVMGAVALACATADRDSGASRREPARRMALGTLALATLLAALVLGPRLVREYPSAVSARVRAAMHGGSQQQVLAEVATGMLAHPSEPSYALLAASDALRRRDPAAGRWINRALQLAPGWASPHVLAATWLWNSGHHKQALLEVIAATHANFEEVHDLACKVTRAWPRGVASVAAKAPDPVAFLEQLGHCARLANGPRAALDRAILHYDPNAPMALLREAARARDAGQYEQALATAQQVLNGHPDLPEAFHGVAAALTSLQRFEQAREVAVRGFHKAPRAHALRELLLSILVNLNDRATLAKVFATMRGIAEDNHELAQAYQREAELERGLGNAGAALRAYQQAYAVGEDPGVLRALADTAWAMGDENRARRVYGQLCSIAPEDVTSCAKAKAPERPITDSLDERPGSAAQQFLK